MLSRLLVVAVFLTSLLFVVRIGYAAELNNYNPTSVDIPDNSQVNSSLVMSGAPVGAFTTNVKVYYEIRHANPAELDIWLTAYYDGSWHDYNLYHQGELGSANNVVETRDNIHQWDGFSPNQTWYLVVRDNVSGTTGYIDFFELWITYTLPPSGNIDLISAGFDKNIYRHGETIYASMELRNNSAVDLTGVHLYVDFLDPDSNSVGGYSSSAFNIPGQSTFTTPTLSLWDVPSTYSSGAYEPRISLMSSLDVQLAVFVPDGSGVVPVLPVGKFPSLKNLIVRSHRHFSDTDSSSVRSVLEEFVANGFHSISMSVKLEIDDQETVDVWTSCDPAPVSGQVLFNSASATAMAQNPLTYDLYRESLTVAGEIGLNIDPWIPTFYDHAQSRNDHPAWLLQNDPAAIPGQDFVDGFLANVRTYEAGLIAEAVASSITAPKRITIDHFRFTNGEMQHGAAGTASITSFVQNIRGQLPAGTELAGYIFLPSDTIWSGQDYTQLEPYLDTFAPMLYWQDWVFSSDAVLPLAASSYVKNRIVEIRSVLGAGAVASRVIPVFGITTDIKLSDGTSRNLDRLEWEKAQINALGAAADEGITEYELFYYGNWFWPVYQYDVSQGRWIDWASYLAGLAQSSYDCGGEPLVRIEDAVPVYYDLLQNAYNDALDGDIIRTRTPALMSNIFFDLNKSITLQGGYGCGFTVTTGATKLDGNVVISNGTVIIG